MRRKQRSWKRLLKEQKNEFGAKTEEAGKIETRSLPSNLDVDYSVEIKETTSEQKNEK